MFKRPHPREKEPAGAEGYRAYVVGYVHGRLDLREDVLAKIHAELQHRPAEKTLLVFVGDLIDRGPASAHVLERLRTYRRSGIETVFLLGNHEEVLLRILQGDAQLITKWRWFGGSECLQSYGLEPEQLDAISEDDALRLVCDAIPDEHFRFV